MSDRVKKVLTGLLLAALLAFQASALAVVVLSSGKSDDGGQVAAAQKAAKAQKLGSYGMVPIRAGDIADGEYEVRVESTSPFFKIVEARLTVSGGDMRADIRLGSESYAWVFMGDMTAAGQAPEADWIPGELSDGSTLFSIPVPALNMPFDCAAYSKARQRWYDRQLLVDAASLPEGALDFELPDYALLERALLAYAEAIPEGEGGSEAPVAAPEPVAVNLPDGEYSVEVNLAGGSGRASVSSPTLLVVREGRAWARLLWSSPYYDYMLIGQTRYDNLTTDGGNSTFEIPITGMDEAMAVVADTTAMGDPVEINYALTFYAESIADKGRIPQEAAKKVLYISAAIIAVGAVLNHFVKKRRR